MNHSQSESKSDASSSRGRPKILIVDDNEALAMTTSWLLDEVGYSTYTCHNGAVGLQQAKALRPDIVILDIGMPGMDGLQVCSAIRADPEMAEFKVIAQSGYGDRDMVQRAKEAGFDRHLIKPVEFHHLLETIKDLE